MADPELLAEVPVRAPMADPRRHPDHVHRPQPAAPRQGDLTDDQSKQR